MRARQEADGCPPQVVLAALFASRPMPDGQVRVTGLDERLVSLLALADGSFLTVLVDRLAAILAADVALVSAIDPEGRCRLVAIHGGPLEADPPLPAPLDGEALLARFGMRTHAVRPLVSGGDRRPLGLLAVLFRQPRADTALAEILFDLLAVRTAQELERHHPGPAPAGGSPVDETLRQAQKLESIGRLAGGIAHDFNNLLSPVLGYVELILAESGHDERQRERLIQVHAAADRARVLVRQLLAFGRKQVLAPRVMSLAAVVANLEHILRRTIREHVNIGFSIDPDAGNIMADPVQIEQVVMNLAMNAQDALPDGGCMEVVVRAGAAEDAVAGVWSVLEVADSGLGMTPEAREHLFEPFFTTKGTGTGMGLATVHGIVSQHGGRILVDSAPGRGSRFRILLQRIDRPVDPASGLRPRIGRHGQGRILVVEDDELVRRLTVEALHDHGYEVEGVPDPAAALACIDRRSCAIDLMLTDVVMPGMDGFELHRLAVVRCPGLKVLYMSGYSDADLLPDEVAEHPDCFLAKPFTIFALTDKVKGMMARKA